MKIAIGNDHAAVELKKTIMEYVESMGHEVTTKRRKDWTNPAEAVSIKGKNKKGDTSDGISNEGIRRGTAARDDGNMERRRGGGNQLPWR